jgi:hypothetical protein
MYSMNLGSDFESDAKHLAVVTRFGLDGREALFSAGCQLKQVARFLRAGGAFGYGAGRMFSYRIAKYTTYSGDQLCSR